MAQTAATSEHDALLEPRTRVDTAHAPDLFSEPNAPSLELLQAIAGQDSEQSAPQLRRQALELATLLRNRHRALDQRESELNARTALLENELRSSRLKQQNAMPPAENVAAEPTRRPTLAEALAATPQEQEPTPLWNTEEEPFEPASERASEPASAEPSPAIRSAEWLESDTEIAEPSTQREQQWRALRQREAKLDSRQQHLNELQEQITRLHREALEMRLATEEVWAQLTRGESPEQLAERVQQARQQLAEHYRLANESLAQRTDELHRMRQELHEQEQRLRGQRRELQLWADRRYDEIQARTSRLMMRERELDRMEAEFERQTMQWQRQREAYRQEIEQLARHV